MQIVRTWDMTASVGFFAGVGACQIEAAVEYQHALEGACQPFGKVGGQNQRRVMGVRHDDPRWTTNFVETPFTFSLDKKAGKEGNLLARHRPAIAELRSARTGRTRYCRVRAARTHGSAACHLPSGFDTVRPEIRHAAS